MRSRLLLAAGLTVLVAAIAVVLLVAADDGGRSVDEDAGPTTQTTQTTLPSAAVSEAPIATTTIVPTSSAPAEAVRSADEIVSAAAPDLALTPGQLDCLRNQLATDPALLAQVGDDPQRGDEGFGVLVETGQRCVLLVDLAPAFIDAIAPSLPSQPTEQQRECLALAYADLTEEDRQAIVSSGLEPNGPNAEAGREVLDGVLANCELRLRG